MQTRTADSFCTNRFPDRKKMLARPVHGQTNRVRCAKVRFSFFNFKQLYPLHDFTSLSGHKNDYF